MKRSCRSVAPLAALALAACATGGGRPSTARLQVFRYSDSGGLSVTSDGVEVAQGVGGGMTVSAVGLVEEISTGGGGLAATDPGDEHHHLAALRAARPDVVTSASTLVSTGAPSQKRRMEGNLAFASARRVGEVPIEVEARFRTSSEIDYASNAGSLHVTADLLDRNFTVSAYAGYGADTVSPLAKPFGQDALWPAGHERVNGGVAVTQLLSPTLALSGGASVNWQTGMLANPYRRAMVETTLFPEVVPGDRLRGTAFARLAWWLGAGTALHVRPGVYADGWGVRAVVPEVVVAKELGRSGMLLGRGRFYQQSAARFYRGVYGEVAPLMSGDVRLGRVRERLVGAELRWAFLGQLGSPGALELSASADRSWVRYPDAGEGGTGSVANVLSFGLTAAF
jgi:hypothetical protein